MPEFTVSWWSSRQSCIQGNGSKAQSCCNKIHCVVTYEDLFIDILVWLVPVAGKIFMYLALTYVL